MLKQTPCYPKHQALGAKLVDFGGWEMPIQYGNVMEEHRHVRERVGLFDIGHMGQVAITGPDTLPFLQAVCTNDAARLAQGQTHYSLFCNEQGGVIDDLLVYRLPEGFLLVVNASNTDRDVAWLQQQATHFDVSLKLLVEAQTLLALQGPQAVAILSALCGISLADVKYYWTCPARLEGVDVRLSRTGYTGEDGFEIFLPNTAAAAIWDRLLDAVQQHGGGPCGLGARDTLRLEAGMPLYGHEYTEAITPFQVGVGWAVKLDRSPRCIGWEALLEAKTNLVQKLVGIEMQDRAVPRAGYAIFRSAPQPGEGGLPPPMGVVTSGTFSPSLQKPIAMAFLPPDVAEGGTVWVQVRNRCFPAQVVALPFYHRRKRALIA